MRPRPTATVIVLALLTTALPGTCALASRSDEAVTSAYLQANHRLVATVASRIPRIEATLRGVLAGIRSECPNAAAGSPQDPQSTALSNEAIGAMVTAVVALDRPAGRAFVAATEHLRWSNRALTGAIQSYVGKVRRLSALPQPHLCPDVRSWAASGYLTLPSSTLSFSPLFMAVWVSAGELPMALSTSETQAERPLLASTERLEGEISELEAREVSTWADIMSTLDLWP